MLNLLKNFVLLIIGLLLSINLLAQKDGNSILSKLKSYNKTQEIDTLLNASEFYAEINPDTALLLGKLAMEMSNRLDDKKAIALSSRRVADAYYYKNEYLKAIDYYLQSATTEYQASNDSSGFLAERLTDAAIVIRN